MSPHMNWIVAVAIMAFPMVGGCSNQAGPDKAGSATMALSSPAFADGQPVPDKYTCHGDDISPPLQWSGAPAQTKSIAVTCEDPDAPMGTFTHWVIFDIPATATGLPENVAKSGALPDGSKQGKNSFGNIGYNGPCPPSGRAHHYIFKVYALDSTVSLDSGASKADLLDAIRGHILAQGKWTGTYQNE